MLFQNYPNPFNPTTTIEFALPEANSIILNIYNINGQLVRRLVSGSMDAGIHNIMWDGLSNNGVHVTSGVYIYSLQAGSFIQFQKMLLMK
jgi:flagellar hook assembly protein FlgD